MGKRENRQRGGLIMQRSMPKYRLPRFEVSCAPLGPYTQPYLGRRARQGWSLDSRIWSEPACEDAQV